MIKKIYGVLLAAIVFFITSCQTNELLTMDADATAISQEEEVRADIDMARNGNSEAYRELAIRYRDGVGVAPDVVKAVIYQGIYCAKTSDVTPSNLNLFENGTANHALLGVFQGSLDYKNMMEKLETLHSFYPDEADAILTLYTMEKDNNYTEGIARLVELEKKGSIFAVLLQLYSFDERKDDVRYEALLNRVCEKQPFFHSMLGEFYEKKYKTDADYNWIEKAIEHYDMADRHAMLTPRFARKYYQLLEHYNNKGLISSSQAELARLKRVSTVHPSSDETNIGEK